jgi:aryl-alcohol dehydrogenase-like predicted oxidoreductase
MIGDILGDAGTAARRRGSTSASDRRVDAAENKAARLVAQLEELEADVEADITEIAAKWDGLAANVTPLEVGLERTDVTVTQLALAWLPVG